jgi:hypothetical protein
MGRPLVASPERQPVASSRRSGPWEAAAGDHLLREIDARTRHWPCDREGRAGSAASRSRSPRACGRRRPCECGSSRRPWKYRSPPRSLSTRWMPVSRTPAMRHVPVTTTWSVEPRPGGPDVRADRLTGLPTNGPIVAARRPRARARLWAPVPAPAGRPSLRSGALWGKWCCLHIQATTYRRTCSPS